MSNCSNNPTSISENNSFTKSIERISNNEFEAELITKAELAYPPRDSVLAAVFPWQHDLIPDTEYWWYRKFGPVYLPFALTIDAIDYYESFIDSLAAEGQDDVFKTAELGYTAAVEFHETFEIYELGHTNQPEEHFLGAFEDVFVVEMFLRFRYECFVHCYLGMGHSRIVVFDEDGNILEIFYDGIQPVAVS